MALAQEKERLDEKIDQITYDWDLEADKLATYDGLSHLCSETAYREKIFNLLDEIHHYDTVLYGVLIKLNSRKEDKEIKQTLREIKKFESNYSSKKFIHFMREECAQAKKIERDYEVTKNDVGINSYSGQIYLLELELFKYVKNTTKSIDHLRKHIHHLSSHYEN